MKERPLSELLSELPFELKVRIAFRLAEIAEGLRKAKRLDTKRGRKKKGLRRP